MISCYTKNKCDMVNGLMGRSLPRDVLVAIVVHLTSKQQNICGKKKSLWWNYIKKKKGKEKKMLKTIVRIFQL